MSVMIAIIANSAAHIAAYNVSLVSLKGINLMHDWMPGTNILKQVSNIIY